MAGCAIVKSEIENLGGNSIFENSERKNNFEVERLGKKIFNFESRQFESHQHRLKLIKSR